MIVVLFLADLVTLYIGFVQGWSFAQSLDANSVISFIIALVCALVLAVVVHLVLGIMLGIALEASDYTSRRLYSSTGKSRIAPQTSGGRRFASKEDALASYERRVHGASQSADAHVPKVVTSQLSEQERNDQYWERVRNAGKLPTVTDLP